MALKDRKAKRGDNRRLLRLGIIRLGHKETKTYQGGKTVEYPVQDDHFVLRDAPEIAGGYGPEPKEIDVLFPFPDIARNFDAFYMVWAGGVPICKGDGEQVLSAWPHRVETKPVMRDGKQIGERVSVYNAPGDCLVDNGAALRAFDWNSAHFEEGDIVPCPGADADMYPHCRACKASGTLKVMIAHPDIFRFGYYQISTGSGRNYDHINDTLEAVFEAAGQVSAIPFKLRVVSQSATYVQDGQRKKTDKYFLQLEPPAEIMMAIIRRQRDGLMRPALAVGPLLPEEVEPFDLDADETAPPPYAEDGTPAMETVDGEFDFDADAALVAGLVAEAEETAGQHPADSAPFIEAVEFGCFDVQAGGKPHIGFMAEGETWPSVRWWQGRTALVEAAPWIGKLATKDELAQIDRRWSCNQRVYYTQKGDFKTAVSFELMAQA